MKTLLFIPLLLLTLPSCNIKKPSNLEEFSLIEMRLLADKEMLRLLDTNEFENADVLGYHLVSYPYVDQIHLVYVARYSIHMPNSSFDFYIDLLITCDQKMAKCVNIQWLQLCKDISMKERYRMLTNFSYFCDGENIYILQSQDNLNSCKIYNLEQLLRQ